MIQICCKSFVWLVAMWHLHYIKIIYVYKKNGGSGCFALAVGSASDGNSAKHCAIFSKMPKANHIKILIFRKHCSCSLINTDGLIYSL